MLTGRRYRLALTPEQAERCEAFGGICRSVWNTASAQGTVEEPGRKVRQKSGLNRGILDKGGTSFSSPLRTLPGTRAVRS